MFTRSTRALFVAVLALGAFVIFVERRYETTEERRRAARRALRVNVEGVRTIRLETDAFRVTLVREGDRWIMTEPVSALADEAAVGRILLALERLPRGQTVTAEEREQAGQTLADYGLDPPRLRLTAEGVGPPLVLRVGRLSPLGDAVYIMAEGTGEVMTTSPGPLSLLPERVDQLRDRSLYRAEVTRARRLDLRRTDGWTRLQRAENGGWMLTAPHPARADAAAVRQLLGRLASARIGEFVQEGPGEPAAFGFDEPAVVVEMEAPEWDPADALLIGRPVPGQPDWRYARFRKREAVFTVPAALAAELSAPAHRFRDRRLTPLAPTEITAIRLERDEETLRLARVGDGWEIAEPTRAPAEGERAEALVRSWAGAPILDFIDPPKAEEFVAEFDPPLGRVLLYEKSVSEAAATVLVSRRPPENGRLRVRVPPEPSVYETAAPLLQLLTPDPLIYRDRRIFSIEPAAVYRLALARDGREQAVRRPPGGPFTAEDGSPVNDARLRERLERLLRARALFYAAERPADLSVFGLDTPAGTLTVGLIGEAGISKTVVVGRTTERGETYAMLRGKDLVFAIDAQTREDLLADLTLDGGKSTRETPPANGL
jgi:hypothetical protein